jgi:hypothetical protein
MTRSATRNPFLFNLLCLAGLAAAGCEPSGGVPPGSPQVEPSEAFPALSSARPRPGNRWASADVATDRLPGGDAGGEEGPAAGGDEATAEPGGAAAVQQPPVWDGDLVLADDAAVLAFCASGFEAVRGTLRIEGAVQDVAPLGCLQWVRGDLAIEFAPLLTRVDGFPALAEVGGDVRIANLASLDTLTGFEALQVLGGSVEVEECRSLRTVSALRVLREIPGDVSLRWNDDVESLVLLDELGHIGGDYVVERFGRGEGLPGLPVLAAVDGDVLVLDNPSLTSVEALYGLDKIGGDLVLDANYALGGAVAEESVGVLAGRVAGQVVLGRNGE